MASELPTFYRTRTRSSNPNRARESRPDISPDCKLSADVRVHTSTSLTALLDWQVARPLYEAERLWPAGQGGRSPKCNRCRAYGIDALKNADALRPVFSHTSLIGSLMTGWISPPSESLTSFPKHCSLPPSSDPLLVKDNSNFFLRVNYLLRQIVYPRPPSQGILSSGQGSLPPLSIGIPISSVFNLSERRPFSDNDFLQGVQWNIDLHAYLTVNIVRASKYVIGLFKRLVTRIEQILAFFLAQDTKVRGH